MTTLFVLVMLSTSTAQQGADQDDGRLFEPVMLSTAMAHTA